MPTNNQKLREALLEIAEIATRAANDPSTADSNAAPEHRRVGGAEKPSCTLKSLPKRLLVPAAQTATSINPINAPMIGNFRAMGMDGVSDPLRISVLTSKYWGPTPRKLTVTFIETTPPDLRARIIGHMNAWTKTGCISFVETKGTGDVRISREGDGYWSYLGTDIKHIPKNRPTMNLQGFTMSTDDGEFYRVVRHETGHTLGFPHEHMRKDLVARIDPEKAYDYFLEDQGWDKKTVDEQVLTPLDEKTLMGTQADQTSIMCYQLPGKITTDGEPVVGGMDVNATDYAFVGKIYPKQGTPPAKAVVSRRGDDWDPSQDVEVHV